MDVLFWQSGRGGRDRFRKEYPLRSDEKSQHGRNNPPSRHLWVGNLSHNLDESSLAHHFLQFGELESVAFQPGRSYAFINFKNEGDAFAAIKELQGFSVAGNPLRIEFTKAVSVVNLLSDFLSVLLYTVHFKTYWSTMSNVQRFGSNMCEVSTYFLKSIFVAQDRL